MQKEIRRIKQPGPINPIRIASFEGQTEVMEINLEVGVSLLDAIAGPLTEAKVSGAGIQFKNLQLWPMNYVMPAFSKSSEHVAYYSDTYSATEEIEITYANATFGIKNGHPFMHCHALWEEGDRICGGHILSSDSIVSKPAKAIVYGTTTITMESLFDPETNFTLFNPIQNKEVKSLESDRKCVVATIRPNEDLLEAIETICKDHQISHAEIRSGVGSVIGARFEDGRSVNDIPTELVVLEGRVFTDCQGNCRANVEVALIDAHGVVYKGQLARGLNPVLICFELVLTTL